MNILVFDCEVYGIEYVLWRATDNTVLARGDVTGVGTRSAMLRHHLGSQSPHQLVAEKATCRDAIKWVMSTLTDPKIGAIGDQSEISAVGYRVTHGANKYSKPVLIDSEVMDDIADFAEFAPKHNPYNLDGIRAVRAREHTRYRIL
ncbi:acetate kinase, partial [Candidatus Eisenbacteria bacterium]